MHILVVMPFEEKHKAYIEEIGKGCTFTYSTIASVTEDEVKEADIIFGNVPARLLGAAGKLKWMQLHSAGADQYCKPGVLPESVCITCATGAYGLGVSEWMVAASFMLARKLDVYMRNQVEHKWHQEGRVASITGSTTLILGLGNIGGEYAKRMKALGSHCIGLRRNPSSEVPEYLDELETIDHLDELLPKADFVAMILPGTPETANIMSAERLARMKPGAFLLNAGRGNAVDASAAAELLKEGRLGGFAMDVVPGTEPLPVESPLWDAPRCIITPHVAGGYFLPATLENIVGITGENLKKYLAGEGGRMQNIVNRSTGYRTR